MERKPEELWYFSEKEGYSAPEVTLQEERNITLGDGYLLSGVLELGCDDRTPAGKRRSDGRELGSV